MKKAFLYICVLLCLIITGLLSAEDGWTTGLAMQERNVGGTALSPDGKWVAYTVTNAVMTGEKSEYLTHIWISALDGSSTFKLTSCEKSCTSPK